LLDYTRPFRRTQLITLGVDNLRFSKKELYVLTAETETTASAQP